jgi:uncharacterized membrane protein YczE
MKKNILQNLRQISCFLTKKKGFGTVEIVLIIAVLISLALLFRTAITAYATRLMTSVFGDESILYSSSTQEDE